MDKSSETNIEKPQNLKNSPTFFSFINLRVAVCAAAILTICAASYYFYLRPTAASQSLAALDEAFRLERPGETRISGMSFAPLADKRGGNTERTDPVALESAKRFAVDAVRNGETAESLHALSRVYLAEKEFDKAEKQLEKAQQLAPKTTGILNDLGIVYLEKSKKLPDEQGGKRLELQARALENFEKAVELEPAYAEAVFNKAICLQTLFLPHQTAEAWRTFLTLDAQSDWSNEARQNLESLAADKPQNKTADELLADFINAFRARDDEKAYRIVSRNREMITGKLIPQRLIFALVESEGAERQEYLNALQYVGELEKQKNGDPFFADLAAYYSSASESETERLKNAQISIKKGYKLALDGDYKSALNEFENARKIFGESGNDLEAEYASFWISYLLTRDNQIRKSSQLLERSLAFCQKNNYKWFSSHILAWLAFNAGSANRYSEEIEFNKKALLLAEDVSDLYNRQRLLSQLSDNLNNLGQYLQALDFAARGLEISNAPESSPRQKWRDYNTAAEIFYKKRLYALAAAYKKESLFLDFKDADKRNYDQPTYVDLGLIYGARGNYVEAARYFDKSFQLADTFTDQSSKNKAVAKTHLQLGHIKRFSKDCRTALTHYDQAVNYYESSEFQPYKYDAHKGRLLCYSAENDNFAFQRELSSIWEIFQKNRAEIVEEQNRNSFFDGEQNIYDIAVDYEFGRGNHEKAFDYAEESRSRSLLDLIKSGAKISDSELNPEVKINSVISRPLKLEELQNQIPDQTQIVQYSVLNDKILIWHITGDSFKAIQTEIAVSELEQDAALYLELITTKRGQHPLEEKRLAGKLYQVLFGRLEGVLDAGKKICLIPDKILFHLPFAALISSDDRYLIDKYTIFLAPSINIFLICSQKLAEFDRIEAESILSIGDPAFNENDFTDLKRLPQAGFEARQIAELYEKRTILIEKEATKERVTESLADSDVIHFAGHYVVDDYSPLLSKLILAEKAGGGNRRENVLANYEIFGEKLFKTRLIVLAACDTGVESYYKGEGLVGASRAFLAAGVPSVVASQWSVDSEATTELMIRFHKYRKLEKLPTVEALRRAQIDLARGDGQFFKHPFYWAGFSALGGFSSG